MALVMNWKDFLDAALIIFRIIYFALPAIGDL